MKRLLVDHFTGAPGADGIRFGRPLQELLQRVERELQETSTQLAVRDVGHEIISCNEVKSIRILCVGAAQLNQLARTWETDFDGLRLVIAPLLFALYGGAYGAFSPVHGLSPSEDDLSPDMLWLAERLPYYAILLRPDAAAGVDADAFVLRHELDHARRCRDALRGRAGVDRAVITVSGESASHFLFGGKLEVEEVFVHAADIEAARLRLLDAGVHMFPGVAEPAHLATGLRDGNPDARVLIAQLQMTAHVGEAIAAQALHWLPRAQRALDAGAEPVYKTCRGVLWGSLPFTNITATTATARDAFPADGEGRFEDRLPRQEITRPSPLETPDGAARLHLPLDPSVGVDLVSRRAVLAEQLGALERTVRDHHLLHTWVTRTLQRFAQHDLAPHRFAAFLRTLHLPAAPGMPGYQPLNARHYKRLFTAAA